MSEYKPVGGKLLTKPFLFLLGLAVIAGFILIRRFLFGLGAVTNLSDGYPWGLWIVYDVLTGTAIACGGYAMALVVYVFNRGHYHPLIRPAIMTSMFGYTLAAASIVIDVGRYWQLYNVFLPWHVNLNSIMFEIAFCVASYVVVLWIEFSPTFLEKWRLARGQKIADRILFVFIALGVLLPTMHQSSLGTLMIIAGDKLSPLWQSSWLPVTYLISAIAMGYGMVILESLFASVGLKRPLETGILTRLARFMPALLGLYLFIRYCDLISRGALGLAFAGDFRSFMFLLETLLFAFPVIFLSIPKYRTRNSWLLLTGIAIVLAGALYRFNAYVIGFDPGPGWHYFPSVGELLVTVGIIAVEIMAYLIFVKRLPVLPKLEHA
ncbi:MAG: Ni/Fe-hydrogenase cytochrome b subunit [Candidatus Neomarinimicrobiota bacterium]